MNPSQWFSQRTKSVEVSGIRKVFDLGRSLKNPINLSIGQPHFDVPEPIKQAAKQAIDSNRNGYTVTQGAGDFRERLLQDVQARYPGAEREVVVTSGTSGGLLLAMLAVIDPGDEVIDDPLQPGKSDRGGRHRGGDAGSCQALSRTGYSAHQR